MSPSSSCARGNGRAAACAAARGAQRIDSRRDTEQSGQLCAPFGCVKTLAGKRGCRRARRPADNRRHRLPRTAAAGVPFGTRRHHGSGYGDECDAFRPVRRQQRLVLSSREAELIPRHFSSPASNPRCFRAGFRPSSRSLIAGARMRDGSCIAPRSHLPRLALLRHGNFFDKTARALGGVIWPRHNRCASTRRSFRGLAPSPSTTRIRA